MTGWRDPGSSTKRLCWTQRCSAFGRTGYKSTSVKDLIERTGLTAASLYNAYGDKRAMFRTALDHYIENSIGARIRRSEALPPRDAIRSFFDDILRRSLSDRERKGCMIVNSALEMAPHDPEFRETIAETLRRTRVILPRLRGEGSGRWDDHLFPAGGRLGAASARRADGRARPGAGPSRARSPRRCDQHGTRPSRRSIEGLPCRWQHPWPT